jgi:hypothetical protein
MIKIIKQVLSYFGKEAEIERKRKAMYDFLSQAQDRQHLEWLENEWFKTHGYQ